MLLSIAPALAQGEIQNTPAKIVSMFRNVEVAPDGSYVVTVRNETLILQQAAIATLAQGTLPYSSLLQDLDVSEAHTKKSDGRVLKVAPEAIIDSQPAATRGQPVLSDIKQKVILYPDVEVGDTVGYAATVHAKPMLPGNFFFTMLLPAIMPVDDATITVSLPKSMAPIADSRGLDMRKTQDGERVIYTIHYSNQHAVSQGAQSVSEFDRANQFAISTFKNYDEFAKAYGALAQSMIAVTPAIAQQADLITQGVSDRREQVRKIYQWVAGHVRYVAVEFGQGSIVPHSAESVLTNAYGDCKDKAVLFAALLKAKGIESNLAIINSGDAYTITGPPNAAPFNHMINWLPEFKMYADTTNGLSIPFGLLPRSEYGKEVIHVADARGARHKVPVPDGSNSTDAYKLTMRVDEAGRLQSESSSTATGDFAAPVRAIGKLVQGENGKKFAAALLAREGTANATAAFIAPEPDLDDPQYRLAATYAPSEPISAFATGAPFRLGDKLQIFNPVSAGFFGTVLDDRFKNADPVTCFPGSSSDDETLEFPASRRLEKLPSDNSIRTSHVSYTSRWSQTATSVSVHREFSARFEGPLCTGAVRQEVRDAFSKIRTDLEASAIALPRS